MKKDHANTPKTCSPKLNRFFAFMILSFVGLPFLSAQDSLLYRRIHVPDTTCSMETAMEIIEQESGLSFSYNTELVDRHKRVTLKGGEDGLNHILTSLFDNDRLGFSIIGRHIVLYESQKVLSANPDKKADSVYFFEVKGRVLDKTDREALPYTSVYLSGKTIGVITNESGDFVLRLNSQYLADSVIISCIGYKRIKAPVTSFLGTEKEYLLKPDVVSIQEVIIRKISPVSLLQSAREAIHSNYPNDPSILTSFYRERIRKGSRYMMISEAILENYKPGYNRAGAMDQIKILKGRKTEDFSATDTVLLKLKAGLSTMLLLDVVKNMPDFLTGEATQDYDYKLADIVLDNGREQYAVEFSPKKSSENAIYSGRILLDIRTLAYTWVEFYISDDKLEQATSRFIVKKPASMKAKVLKANYKIAFRKTGSRYYLHMIECETEFRIKKKNQLSASVFKTAVEMAVTDIDTVNASRFRFREAAKLNDFFTDQLGEYDASFWGEYNFISPDESLEEAVERLSRKLR
jgi:hypothetical protein